MIYVLCNKETSILEGDDKYLTYSKILKNLIESSPLNGATIAQMKQDFTIIDKLEEDIYNIDLSLDELDRLIDVVETTQFAVKHRDLVDLYDDLVKLKNTSK